MEVRKGAISLGVVLWLAATSALEAEQPEVTTESFQFPTFETTSNVTESPDDNGMVIGAIPPEMQSPRSKEEEEPPALEQQPALVSFPDNHKNFTPSQYLGDQDFPPYYNRLNPYQQQYKNYNEQKQMFSRKPIKFEESVFNNYYLPPTPNSFDGEGAKKTENVRVNRNPFPYAFESERTRENWHKGAALAVSEHKPEHEQSYKVNEKAPNEWYKQQEHQHSYNVHEQAPEGWYKHPGHMYEPPGNDHVFRGHHDTPLPYYHFPHAHPQEDKLFHNPVLHLDHHHHLKKDDKGSAWKKVFHVLTALVPLGLILASLSPNVISINSTSTSKTTRQRSEDVPPARFKEEDVLKLIKKYGVESLNEAQCEDRILCELAVEGGKTSSGPVEKGFWFLANQTPWDVAQRAGMNDLFAAIRSQKCDTYRCQATAKPSGGLGKKPTWKRKTAK